MSADIITGVVERWHAHLRGDLAGGLDALLADDVVFYSPIVFTPQEGKAITKLYLEAASHALSGEAAGQLGDSKDSKGFRYTKQILDGDCAVLEFETTVDGKYANGVDIIRCNEAGQIIEFRVMFRPLQAVNAVHVQMAAILERMQTKP